MIHNRFDETGLDRELPYIPVRMDKVDTAIYPRYTLPEGYGFRYYEPGMEEEFARLQYLVGGTASAEAAREVFMREFGGALDLLGKRMIYAVNANGECAGLACLWQGEHMGKIRPRIHWVTVHPAHQNKGISKALLTMLFDLHSALRLEQPIYLDTQTWSYKAINIYLEFGFNPWAGQELSDIKPTDAENNDALAWNLIFDKIEQYKKAKEMGETDGR